MSKLGLEGTLASIREELGQAEASLQVNLLSAGILSDKIMGDKLKISPNDIDLINKINNFLDYSYWLKSLNTSVFGANQSNNS